MPEFLHGITEPIYQLGSRAKASAEDIAATKVQANSNMEGLIAGEWRGPASQTCGNQHTNWDTTGTRTVVMPTGQTGDNFHTAANLMDANEGYVNQRLNAVPTASGIGSALNPTAPTA